MGRQRLSGGKAFITRGKDEDALPQRPARRTTTPQGVELSQCDQQKRHPHR